MVKRIIYERIGLEIIRLVLLAFFAGLILVGSYWLLQDEFWLTVETVWNSLAHFWKSFSLYDYWQGLLAWVSRMWIQFLVIEIPKRILIAFGVPYLILIFIGPQRRKRLIGWFDRRQRVVRIHRYMIIRWFRKHFGKYAGFAIGFLVATIIGVIFWFVFGTFIFLWLGLWQTPKFIAVAIAFLSKWVIGLIQKIPFRTTLFKVIGRMWKSLITVPWVPEWLKGDKAYQRRRRAARWAIKRRYWKERRIKQTGVLLATWRARFGRSETPAEE